MVKKKLTKKKLKRILGDACSTFSAEYPLQYLLVHHYKEVQEYLGVAPRTLRRYRQKLQERMSKRYEDQEKKARIDRDRTSKIGELLDREEKLLVERDRLREKVKSLTEYKYTLTNDYRNLELKCSELRVKKNGLLVAWILTAILFSLTAYFRGF